MLSQRESDVWTTSGTRRIAIIGGGISGLSAAYKLCQAAASIKTPVEVMLFEGSPRVGGTINTYNLDDTILELGPDSFITEKPAALELCRELGIQRRLVETDDQHRRTFIAHQNRLHALPDGFMMMAPTQLMPLLSSPLFTWQGKMRMLKELFVPPGVPHADESLREFTERRLGREAFERVVQPLVGGIYTADPDRLSVKAALPRIHQLEQKHGSLIKGMMAGKRQNKNESGPRYSMFVTFDEGMNVLVNALERALPKGCVRTHSLVSRVKKAADGAPWRLQLTDGSLVSADAVVIATSTFHAADILTEVDKPLANNLRKIQYASSAVLNIIYRRSDVKHPLDGFGFVVPRTEKRHILACSFTSVKWPGRAPRDKVLLRVFIGGALQPDVYELADEQIECLMWEDLHTYLGVRSVPLLSVISRHPRSMPQYNIGHSQLVQEIEEAVANLPGLALAGNAYHGVGIPDCIASGQAAAERILQHLPAHQP